MGRTLKPIPFWAHDLKIKQVISASRAEWFSLKSLARFSSKPAHLSQYDNGNFLIQFLNQEFIEFEGA